MVTANIASHLPAMAKEQPDTLAVAIQEKGSEFPRYTYKELDDASDVMARGLQQAGIGKGSRVVLMVKPGLEFFELVFALFKMGAVLVAIDPGMGVKNLKTCLSEAEPDAFIGIGTAQLARLLLGWCRGRNIKTIHAGNWSPLALFMKDCEHLRKLGRSSEAEALVASEADDAAAILFTSGSTGVPKGVNYNHGNFTAQVKALQQLYNIEPGEVDLATFPLFALFAPAMGMTSIIPDMDFTRPGSVDAQTIVDAIKDFSATTMFGSPALLDRVGRWAEGRDLKLHGLKRVISAGAPVSAEIIERFTALLDENVKVFTPYGATEALPVASINSEEILKETAAETADGKGVCVGRPVAGMEVNIIDISDDAITSWSDAKTLGNGEVGEIVVKGEQVTGSYYNRESSTLLAKINCDDGSFYHRMGDLGFLDETGRLWFCGRKSERVVCEERTYFTACCEGVFNQHEKVKRTALVGVGEGKTRRPVLCVELETSTDTTALINELLELGAAREHSAAIKQVLIHPGFPVDIRHNAKIGRAQLADWAGEQR